MPNDSETTQIFILSILQFQNCTAIVQLIVTT